MVKAPKIPQSRDQLIRQLHEQIALLKASARSYDAGFEAEAKRMALGLRILLYDTGRSSSLLATLGLKETLRFPDMTGEIDEDRTAMFVGLSMGFTPDGLRYHAKLGKPKREVQFQVWWDQVVILQKATHVRFTRKDIITSVADMYGGAHVDPELDAAYAALARDNAFGWTVWKANEQPSMVTNGPELPFVRQFAHEVVTMFDAQLEALLH